MLFSAQILGPNYLQRLRDGPSSPPVENANADHVTWLTVKACSCEVHRVHTSSAFSFKVRLCVPKNKRTHSSPVTRWSDIPPAAALSVTTTWLRTVTRPGPSLSTPGPVGTRCFGFSGWRNSQRRRLVKQTEWTVLFNYIIWWLGKQTQTELVVWRLVRQTQTELCYLTV